MRDDAITESLLREHRRLSDRFEKYTSSGGGAPAFARQIHDRLTALEEALVRSRALSEQDTGQGEESGR